jgi:large subunit ribosomal protein L15e
MVKDMYKAIAEQWRKEGTDKQKLIEWRKGNTIERIENSTRLDRARALGYRAKSGYILARVKIKKGGRRRRLFGRKGRKPSKSGLIRFRPKSLQWIAEGRVQKRFPNLVVLNSYFVGEDGKSKFFEVILVDPENPSITNDRKINWICSQSNRRRVFHGLTSSAKKSRGLR